MILPALLFATSLLSGATTAEIKQEAQDAILKLQKHLQKPLKANLKKGGPLQAANFCSTQAQSITHEINTSFARETRVHRTSLKYRNNDNSPKSDEREVLEQMQKEFDTGKKLPQLLVKKIYANTYKVYKPIFINKGVCLACHGDATTRDPEAYKDIKFHYPQDKAINYKMHDLRGAFVVKIVLR